MLHKQGKEINKFYSVKSLEDASLSVTNNSKIHLLQLQFTSYIWYIFSAFSKNNNNNTTNNNNWLVETSKSFKLCRHAVFCGVPLKTLVLMYLKEDECCITSYVSEKLKSGSWEVLGHVTCVFPFHHQVSIHSSCFLFNFHFVLLFSISQYCFHSCATFLGFAHLL